MQKSISVKCFYEQTKPTLKLRPMIKSLLGGDKRITKSGLNKPGLALTGYFKGFKCEYLQVFAPTEVNYINERIKNNDIKNFEKFCKYDIPGIICQGKKRIHPDFVAMCEKNNIPLFKTTIYFHSLYHKTIEFLDNRFAQSTQIHGTLVDVYGTGLLIMGRSSIGKSEIALDLVERGHRLVADDVVTVTKRGEQVLIGTNHGDYTPFMEIRGLGIINVKEMFGTRAIRVQKRVEMVILLEDWKADGNYERVGEEDTTIKILGVELPRVKLPIYPGKNITVIAETIALNLHLKVYGYNAAKEFNKLLISKMKRQKKLNSYLSKDYE
ncbi:MAG: HPr(Ser) kinase/phosphatase [Candidatus Delongbacteria bacterium]|nr:HPr(Ser) kinase/phosphatase [Candidatus Delongbacteria bacterium]